MTFALGIAAALIAPFAMVLGFIVWDNHWTGSVFALNMYKCSLASIGFAILTIYTSTRGELFPPEIFTAESVGFLLVSSTIGILIGDWTWLEGMRLLGARKVIVMDTLKPFLAALLGRALLDEHFLTPAAFGGLILAVLGVLLVGLEKEKDKKEEDDSSHVPADNMEKSGNSETDDLLGDSQSASHAEKRRQRKQPAQELYYGLFMSIMNVILHTFGALLTKTYGVGMTVWEINLIRFGFSGACMLLISFFMHLREMARGEKMQSRNDTIPWYSLPMLKPKTWWIRVSLGVLFVSFLMPALTNYAMFQIALGLLLTLESIGPLYSLPLSYLLQNERPTLRACLGAVLAVAGIVILSFRGTLG
jgi:drug/metabolite transporter (DMT)-like permease